MDQYDGIIIAPYQWPARLDRRTQWYYGWDVASGCVWNLKAISVIVPNVQPVKYMSHNPIHI